MTLRLWKTRHGLVVERDDRFVAVDLDIDDVYVSDDPAALLDSAAGSPAPEPDRPLAPIGSQEIWAAGVTYQRSRSARIEESEDAQDAYEKVYDAERPELFFKSLPGRVADPGTDVHIRRDATWNVPEPELTLAINANGDVFGYCVGNDVSSRDIEGENPLYLPQAKVYDRSAAVGPALTILPDPPAPETGIHLQVDRDGEIVLRDSTSLASMHRSLDELVGYLYSELTFPTGCLLMTGTGIVPDSNFTLRLGDRVTISIDGIGQLRNTVGQRHT